MKFTVHYTSLLSNPNIRISIYRRLYNQIYETNYEIVDLQDYVRFSMTSTDDVNYEYMLISSPRATNQMELALGNSLLTGTYRLVFKLYDNDTLIGDVTEYIIIK